jgi:hypothetical protein
LKIFDGSDEIDTTKLMCVNPKNITRKPKRGDRNVIGWRKGLKGYTLLNDFEARWYLFINPYKSLLEERLWKEVRDLKRLIQGKNVKVILLDHQTNCDINDLSRPLSHAYLLKCFLEDKYPCIEDFLGV